MASAVVVVATVSRTIGVGYFHLFFVCFTSQPGTASSDCSPRSRPAQLSKTNVIRARSLSCPASPA